MAAAKSSSAKKRRSSSTVAANTDAAAAAVSNADEVKISGKKRRVAPSKTAQVAAPLSAVAARRLAAAKALEEQASQEQSNAASSSSTASVVQDDADNKASQKSASEDSEAGDDEDDEDDEPVASTSKDPYTALKIHDGRPKRYFLGGAASLDSSTAPSPAAEDEPAEVSFAPSEGEYINTEDVSRSEPAAYSKRPSRRRRRAENAAKYVHAIMLWQNYYTNVFVVVLIAVSIWIQCVLPLGDLLTRIIKGACPMKASLNRLLGCILER